MGENITNIIIAVSLCIALLVCVFSSDYTDMGNTLAAGLLGYLSRGVMQR